MVKIIKTLGTLYLSLIALHTITAKPADTDDKPEDTTTTEPIIEQYSKRQKCKPNTKSCKEGYSCIRFNSDKEDEYSCIQTELAFCDSDEYCQNTLGKNYKYCYQPPWNKDVKNKQQCFEQQNSGSHCLYDFHCVNNLTCENNICVSSVGNLEDVTQGNYDFEGKSTGSGTILGINKWVFIGAVSFPVVVLIFCIWCWLIGRSSSRAIERRKKERYEKEIKELTIPQTSKDKTESNAGTPKPKYYDPQKEIEEEVGKRTFKSLLSKRKKNKEAANKTEEDKKNGAKEESIDISTTKVGGNAPINTSSTSDTQQKMKKNLSSADLEENEKEKGKEKEKEKSSSSGTTRNMKKATKTPSTPGASSSASLAVSSTSATGKPRGTKKKAATGAKKTKKTSTSTGNDTNTNSTSSKQSSQRGLVNNAANLSSALSGQSASYFSGVSTVDQQNALYYQQMYNAAAAQNPYYASYLQNQYYAAAAQNAAYYAQDPNLMYGAYPNTTNYQ